MSFVALNFGAHGFSPCGFSGFCLGSVASYGQAAVAEGDGGVAGENQPVICASQSIFGAEVAKNQTITLSTNMFV